MRVRDGSDRRSVSRRRSAPPVNLTEVSLEELLTIKVTSAGKRDQLITETAAAVYVITSDDIRRYNASTITDLLRQVPGILVARQATGEWSISIRAEWNAGDALGGCRRVAASSAASAAAEP